MLDAEPIEMGCTSEAHKIREEATGEVIFCLKSKNGHQARGDC